MSEQLIEAPESVVNLVNEAIEISRPTVALYKSEYEESLLSAVMGKSHDEHAVSNQGTGKGVRPHPFNYSAVYEFQFTNVHHSTCLNTKTSATVGLGFGDDDGEDQQLTGADAVLDPLCERSWADLISDVAEDYWQVGAGYIEVVRNEAGDITGLHFLSAARTKVYVENDQHEYHYVISPSPGGNGREQRFARFGDRDDFLRRWEAGIAGVQGGPPGNATAISEVIQIRQPSSISRWYGFPDWISATVSIELTQNLHQWKYDFFLNRGVPEFMLFILGAKLSKEDWKKIENSLKANIGKGQSHKSLALNLVNSEIKVQLEKLALEGKQDDDFGKLKENLAMDIVSAHRVPPLLAGILVPGKLGATNELANAILGFDLLVIRPAQRNFQQTLGATLGNPRHNGGLGLQRSDFKFQRLVDQLDIGALDTVSRMRTEAASAEAEGRDVGDGLRD